MQLKNNDLYGPSGKHEAVVIEGDWK